MTFLVFKDTKLVGHTESKKILKRFLKERKGTYTVQEIEAELISSDLKDSDDFYQKQLDEYREYGHVLTEEELMYALEVTRERLVAILNIKKELRESLKFIRLKGEEKFVVDKFMEFADLMEEDLDADYESAVFLGDYFDVQSIVDLLIRKV